MFLEADPLVLLSRNPGQETAKWQRKTEWTLSSSFLCVYLKTYQKQSLTYNNPLSQSVSPVHSMPLFLGGWEVLVSNLGN